MLWTGQQPEGWFKYMQNYVSVDRPVTLSADGRDTEEELIHTVLLKILNCSEDRYYYVCPGQQMGDTKFHSESIKRAYIHMKYLKKILG